MSWPGVQIFFLSGCPWSKMRVSPHPNVHIWRYIQTSNISCTKSKNLNVSCIVLQLFLPNPLKLSVLSREWRSSWSSADRRCSNYIWVINNYIAHYGAIYIRGLIACESFEGQPRVVMNWNLDELKSAISSKIWGVCHLDEFAVTHSDKRYQLM